MKPRATIFLSGVSHEFGSFRDAVENEIQIKGCFAENQTSFAPDYSTVEDMLRRRMHDADAVVHIVGFRFGAEPNERPPEVLRRSYTQMEFDIAREMQKPVYIFLSTDASVRDKPKANEQPEDAEPTALQVSHRGTVQKTNYLYYFFKDKAELCKLVAEIPPLQAANFRADISRIIKYNPSELIGRDNELNLLDHAWAKVRRAESSRQHVLTFVALGGEGKTSLVAKWAADLAFQDWLGCDSAFAWSFYSQGTRDQMAASSDLFLKEALTFFGDVEMANSVQGAFEKGRRLAQLIGDRRALLVLDGLEPLQFAPSSTQAGELKDQGVSALLKGLAVNNKGLCLVTTRYSLTDLKNYWQTTAPEIKLLRLSPEAGVALLKSLGLHGVVADFNALVEEVKGHALTLNLLGSYLHDAHGGDVRKRDLVKLEEANAEEQGGHAFHVMDKYVKWFDGEGAAGQRAIALLRLLGLFDRPASADLLTALKHLPIIEHVSEAFFSVHKKWLGLRRAYVPIDETQWNTAHSRLERARLLTVNRDALGTLRSLDAHPLLREYFAQRLRTQHPVSWRAAHRRLYEHLCATTEDKVYPTLEELQPLFQAVAHGCQAGMHRKALGVFYRRILRGQEFYSVDKLGAISATLGAVACFFEQPWSRLVGKLTDQWKSFLLSEAAISLRALGRLAEALDPQREALELSIAHKQWHVATTASVNLSELEVMLGDLPGALSDAAQSVRYADHGGDAFSRQTARAVLANALHHAGRRPEAEASFREVEAAQAEREPAYLILYSMQGFMYCDLLLTDAERAAWQTILQLETRNSELKTSAASSRAVFKRARQLLQWDESNQNKWLLDLALNHLTAGRAALYTSLLNTSATAERTSAIENLNAAVDGLHRAGHKDHLPIALLSHGWLNFLDGATDDARTDLDEAWEIAERGPMRLFMADIHLYRARLFHEVKPYPWNKNPDGTERGPKDDLKDARTLIEKCGYWRRKEELDDAEEAAKNW